MMAAALRARPCSSYTSLRNRLKRPLFSAAYVSLHTAEELQGHALSRARAISHGFDIPRSDSDRLRSGQFSFSRFSGPSSGLLLHHSPGSLRVFLLCFGVDELHRRCSRPREPTSEPTKLNARCRLHADGVLLNEACFFYVPLPPFFFLSISAFTDDASPPEIWDKRITVSSFPWNFARLRRQLNRTMHSGALLSWGRESSITFGSSFCGTGGGQARKHSSRSK